MTGKPNKDLIGFITAHGTHSGLVQRGKIHGKGENVKTIKANDLTLAQVMTLHRMRCGIPYKLLADGKKGGEVTNQSSELLHAPSIPALYRMGLVNFTGGKPTAPADQGKFFQVSMTAIGWSIAEEFHKAVSCV